MRKNLEENNLREKWVLTNSLQGVIDTKIDTIMLIDSINILLVSVLVESNSSNKPFLILGLVLLVINLIYLILVTCLFLKVRLNGKNTTHIYNYWSLDNYSNDDLNSTKNLIELIKVNKETLDLKLKWFKWLFWFFVLLLFLTIALFLAIYINKLV